MQIRVVALVVGLALPISAIANARNDMPPPMDFPPLAWFQYNKDDQGRATYLSKICLANLRLSPRVYIGHCADDETKRHKEAIAAHDQEADRIEYESTPAGKERLLAKSRDGDEREIAWDHSIIMQCRHLMAQQRSAAKISGYIDAGAMQGCGMSIQAHTENMMKIYARYKASGGKKPLPEIYARPDAGPKSPYAW